MKKILTFLAAVCMVCAIGATTACSFTGDQSGSSASSADTSGTSSDAATYANYTTEYWFETADGYERNDELTTVQQGEIGKTVQMTLQNFSGYFFESGNANNVLRGRVKEDGTLVLKAYYSFDYTDRVVIQTELPDEIDILKGEEKQLAVTVLVDGQPVTDGVVFKSEDNNIQIGADGVMLAKMRGQTTVSVSYKNVSKSFAVSIWDAYIASEEDWWKVYENTALWYKFTNDVTLSENTIAHFTDADNGVQGYLVNHEFSGVIDGGGYSLTYDGSRLFHWVTGQIRNITLYAGEGFYWGAPIAFGCTGGIISNVTVHAAYNTPECLRAINADFWIKLGGNEGVNGNGGMFGMIETGAVISDCTVYMDVRKVDSSAFGGIAYQATGSVVENCVVYSTDGDVSVIELNVGDSTTITDCTVHAIENTAYTVEYYFETDDGFVREDAYTYQGAGLVGDIVTANTMLGVSGFEFDAENGNNVLSGRIEANGALVLKVYYKKAAVTVIIESDHAESFEMDKTATVTIPVTVTANGEPVTEGIVWTSADESIATVENGVVTVVKGGTTTVTVSYMGMNKSFTVTAYDRIIRTEEDWWSIYTDADTLAGWYKLANDLTLTKNSVEYFNADGLGHTINHTFSGLLDGDNHSITYNGTGSNRLFAWISGTIKNVTIRNGAGYYWGGPVAYGLQGTAENVTVYAIFERQECWYAVSSDFWIQLGGNEGVFGNGGMFGWIDYATVTNCHVIITVLDTVASTDGFGGLAYGATGATITDCSVTVKGGALPLVKLDTDNTIVNSTVKDFEKGSYTVEYYFESADGFVKDDSYTVYGEAYVGETVTANTSLAVEGFYYDETVAENVLSGVVEANGTLVLKVYYKETIVANIESEYAESFEMDKTATVTIPVTVTANGKPVTEGVVWTSADENVVTVESGVVTVVKGGTTTVTVSYMGTSKSFTVTAYDRIIRTEEDWWSIYTDADTLAGWYKLANDLTLTKSSADRYEGAYNASETFTGKIDGNGKTLTYSDNRLFCWLSGATIENINLVAGNGFYWGAGIAYGIQGGSVVRNVTANFTFVWAQATWVHPTIGWISTTDIGAICIYLTEATLDNVDVTVTLTDTAKAGATFYGLVTEITNSTAINCDVRSADELALFKTQSGTNNTEGSTFTHLIIELNGATEGAFDLSIGAEQNLNVSASYAGEDKTSEVVFATTSDCVTVENGVITAVQNGQATVTASFMGKTLTYTVTVYTKFIATEEDWWSIYTDADTLAGWYKLANDLTLTKSSADRYEGAYNASETFTGKIDGNGKTLTYVNNRLFCWLSGATIENINLVAGNGFYWGAGIAYGIQGGSVVRNVTANFTFVQAQATWVHPAIGWISTTDIGAICIYLTEATLDNVDVTVTLTDTAKAGATFYGLVTEITNSTAINCDVRSADELALFKTQSGTNNTEGSTFTRVIPDATIIASEADFWAMYESAEFVDNFYKITGTYVLSTDIVLTEVPANKFGSDTLYNFAGTIIGNGHKITYGGSRLFAVMYGGRMENVEIELLNGCYLGSAIAFDIKNATFKDMQMTVNFDTPRTHYAGIEQGGMGVLGVWMDATTVDNVDIGITFSGEAANDPTYFCGIAQNISNSTISDCAITACVDIGLGDNIDAATVITKSSVTVVE